MQARHPRRERERGFVLIVAVVIAVLFFGLIELQLIESSRALREAQSFRARIIANAMAENGAELAAEKMVNGLMADHTKVMPDGTCSGRYGRTSDTFTIEAKGSASGVARAESKLMIEGRFRGTEIAIDYARYSP